MNDYRSRYQMADGQWQSCADYMPRSVRTHDYSELEELYGGILDNPFGPRYALADCLLEHGHDRASQAVADYRGGQLPALPLARELTRWEGPGLIGQGDAWTHDVWVGASGQYMQACNAGLFVKMPITTVIVWNLVPWDGSPYPGNNDLFAYIRESIRATSAGIQSRLNIAEEHAINDVIADFYPKIGVDGYLVESGVYTSSKAILANLALSRAYVNLGRYAAGLPELEWTVTVPAGWLHGFDTVRWVTRTRYHPDPAAEAMGDSGAQAFALSILPEASYNYGLHLLKTSHVRG